MSLTEHITTYLRAQLPTVAAIYVFGSEANGPTRQDSDVDVAILGEHPLPALERWTIATKLANLLNRDVDLVDLHRASTVMQFQVVSTGQRIFTRDEATAERYELRVYRLYLTLNDDRAGILAAITASGTVYDEWHRTQ